MDHESNTKPTAELLSDANTCFVCGPNNPEGLQLQFELVGDYCCATFTPRAHHCGFAGVTHGGIIFSVLDDVMANWLFLQGHRAVTAKCDLRYKSPLPTETEVEVKSWCIKRRGKMAVIGSEMRRSEDAVLVAQCEATFMITSQ